ncbi:tripartite tricarboxylate transporter TctB family protein [Yoonia sp. 2307UL14-13]|uniref:tripartite tricarboxylate transporter TctB family protein n=1 Tax=Yoonia sp. 2307UL14-13 TaxID=3126506 RepID=UPI003098615B
MLTADRMIAAGIMLMSLYFMWHAQELPIGWVGATGGPGGGAFPFWLSLVMFACAGGILVRSFRDTPANTGPFFDPETLSWIIAVIIALTTTVALMPWLGAYIALPLFLFWYLKIFGKHGWVLTLLLSLGTPVFLFFFFEVTLKILLPKGITQPLFVPLYAMFF